MVRRACSARAMQSLLEGQATLRKGRVLSGRFVIDQAETPAVGGVDQSALPTSSTATQNVVLTHATAGMMNPWYRPTVVRSTCALDHAWRPPSGRAAEVTKPAR